MEEKKLTITEGDIKSACCKLIAENETIQQFIEVTPVLTLAFMAFSIELQKELFKEDK